MNGWNAGTTGTVESVDPAEEKPPVGVAIPVEPEVVEPNPGAMPLVLVVSEEKPPVAEPPQPEPVGEVPGGTDPNKVIVKIYADTGVLRMVTYRPRIADVGPCAGEPETVRGMIPNENIRRLPLEVFLRFLGKLNSGLPATVIARWLMTEEKMFEGWNPSSVSSSIHRFVAALPRYRTTLPSRLPVLNEMRAAGAAAAHKSFAERSMMVRPPVKGKTVTLKELGKRYGVSDGAVMFWNKDHGFLGNLRKFQGSDRVYHIPFSVVKMWEAKPRLIAKIPSLQRWSRRQEIVRHAAPDTRPSSPKASAPGTNPDVAALARKSNLPAGQVRKVLEALGIVPGKVEIPPYVVKRLGEEFAYSNTVLVTRRGVAFTVEATQGK